MVAINEQYYAQMLAAATQSERLPKLRIGYSYVLDVDSIKLESSSNPQTPGVVFLAAVYTVVETDDPAMPIGCKATHRPNMSKQGGQRTAQAIICVAVEAFTGQRFDPSGITAPMLGQLGMDPCPLAGARLYATVTPGKMWAPPGKPPEPWPEVSYEPMQRGASKGLRAQAPVPAQAPAQGGAPWAQPQAPQQPAQPAQVPWAQPQQAPAPSAPPWQQAAPAQPAQQAPWQQPAAPAPNGPPPGTPWPAGMPWTPGR